MTLACTLVALLLRSPAYAQGAPQALALFEQGVVALQAAQLDIACAKFKASDDLAPSVRARANLGECEEKRGRLASAWAAYVSAFKMLDAADPRYSSAKQHVDGLASRLPRLVLELVPGAPAGVSVAEGPAVLGSDATWGVALPYDPGPHHLVVTVGGKVLREIDVTLAEGRTETVQIPEAPPATAPPVAPPAVAPPAAPVAPIAPRPPPPPPPPVRGTGAGPWVVGGVGLASLVAAGVMGGLVLHEKSVNQAGCDPVARTCTQTARDAAHLGQALGAATTTTLVAGAAGVLAGGLWLGLGGPARAKVGMGPGTIAAGGAW